MQADLEAAGEPKKQNKDVETLRLVESFKSRAKSANRIALFLITIMITFWLSGLEPRADAITNYLGVLKLKSITNSKASLAKNAESNPSAIIQQELVPESQPGNRVILSEVRDRNSQAQQDQRQSAQRQSDQSGGIENRLQELKELESEAKKQARVPYEFPGGLKASIPLETAPVLWLALSFFSLAYFLGQRNSLLRLGSRVARYMIEAPKQSIHFQEILDDAPWWLAPLPHIKGEIVSNQDLKTTFGWTNDLPFSAMSITCYVLLILAQVKVLFLVYIFVNLDDQSHHEWIDWVAPTTASLLVLSSIAILATSFSQAELPDRLPSYDSVVSLPRRKLLCFGALGTAGALFGGFLNRIIDRRFTVREFVARNYSQYRYTPRFRRRNPGHKIQQLRHSRSGLYVNTKSSVVHYVSKNSKIYSPPGVVEANLKAVPGISDAAKDKNLESIISRLETGKLIWAAEAYALSLIEQDRIDPALQFLRLAIRTAYGKGYGKKAIRLCNLLAGLAVRYRRQEFLRVLTSDSRFVCTEFLADDSVKARLKTWTDQKSKWFQKWARASDVLPWKSGTLLT